MKNKIILLLVCLCAFEAEASTRIVTEYLFTLSSPDAGLTSTITIGNQVTFTLENKGRTIIAPSAVSMTLQSGEVWGSGGVKALKHLKDKSVDERIPSPFYKRAEVRDHYNQLTLTFKGNYSIVFRMYDDGLAYRFVTTRKDAFTVTAERAEFRFARDFDTFAPYSSLSGSNDINSFEPQFRSSQENLYTCAKATQLDPRRLIMMPMLVTLDNGARLCIAEADLENYPGMFLNADPETPQMRGVFAPYPAEEVQGGHNKLQMIVTGREQYIARVEGARSFPWRTFIVTTDDTQLVDNDMVYRLAAPSRVADVSWIKPGKVAWEWWNNWGLYDVDFRAGINTETYKYYIDFASKHGVEYVILDEGWAVKYECDLMKVVPEIDLPGLLKYAEERNVGIILWAGYYAIARDMENVVKHYAAMGVKGFKVDFMDRDDQKMMDFMYRLADVCARERMMIDYHGCSKPAGLQRTYPNVINYEAVFGLEQMKWSSASTDMVTYDVILPFIRMVAGPMDYTQGAMRNSLKGAYTPNYANPMSQGTRCRQLAEYVVFHSPLNMLCDSPSNYMREQECIRFIASVPTVWDDTKVLDGRVGEYVAVARRAGDEWFVGAMTDWTARELTLEIPVDGNGRYEVEIFRDGINADRAAQDYKREVVALPADGKLTLRMAPGGGWAARVYKL